MAAVTDMKSDLVATSTYVFTSRIRPRLEGLTDDEYFWEPVAGCWSLRPDPDGLLRSDGTPLPSAGREPFTTLAWRLWHLTGCYGATRNATMLGTPPNDGRFNQLAPAPATAAVALTALDDAFAWWSATLDALTPAQFGELMGPVAGPYAEATRAGFVLHQLDEMIHHGAETALMRDLYRAQVSGGAAPPASLAEAAANGYWARVRDLLGDAAVDASAGLPGDFGRTPLHYAAASAPRDVVERLVERGADVSVRDEQFNMSPRGWAEYFGRADLSDAI